MNDGNPHGQAFPTYQGDPMHPGLTRLELLAGIIAAGATRRAAVMSNARIAEHAVEVAAAVLGICAQREDADGRP